MPSLLDKLDFDSLFQQFYAKCRKTVEGMNIFILPTGRNTVRKTHYNAHKTVKQLKVNTCFKDDVSVNYTQTKNTELCNQSSL